MDSDLLHEEHVLLFGDAQEIFQLFQVKGDWFLAQDVFTSQQSVFGWLVMESMRRSNVYRIDILPLA